MIEIKIAVTDEEIKKCFPVMQQLRPHIKDAETFLRRVKSQQNNSGYFLAYLQDNNNVKSCAGFIFAEKLFSGRMMYVDDLVSDEGERSKGYGDKLFDWLVNHAKENNCDQLHLDSGVHRHGAHRFYLRKRMDITSYHFVLKLTDNF